MVTFHPSVTKAHPCGFRSVVLIRADNGSGEQRKVGRTVYGTSEQARTEARARAHNAERAILSELPAFPIRVA